MIRKVLIQFNAVIPSHISQDEFNENLIKYIMLFRYTTQIERVENVTIDTAIDLVITEPNSNKSH